MPEHACEVEKVAAQVEVHIDHDRLAHFIELVDPRQFGKQFLAVLFDVEVKQLVNDAIGKATTFALVDQMADADGQKTKRIWIRMRDAPLM
jgi:hypothetical protein